MPGLVFLLASALPKSRQTAKRKMPKIAKVEREEPLKASNRSTFEKRRTSVLRTYKISLPQAINVCCRFEEIASVAHPTLLPVSSLYRSAKKRQPPKISDHGYQGTRSPFRVVRFEIIVGNEIEYFEWLAS